MAEKKCIAILSVSAGAGHVRAAEALKATADERYDNLTVIHIDVMDFVPKLFRKLYAESYIDIVDKHPTLWGYLYKKTDVVKEDSQLQRLRVGIENINTKKLRKALSEISPDSVICTHFLPAELLSRMIKKKKFDVPCWVQVTDFDVHSLWIHSHMAGYFAASEEVAWRMEDRGIDCSTVSVTGIPIMPAFGRSYSRATCIAETQLDPDKKIVLMMAGGKGVGKIDQLAERLIGLRDDYQLVALAGKNEKLLAKLNSIADRYPGRLVAKGFTREIEVLMAASDFAITKPGGLTTSECLAMGLPIIAVSPIPGQEERNADYILENGAGLKAYDVAGLEYRVKYLLENPAELERMKQNALSIGRPGAAAEVLKKVVENG